MRLSFSFLLWFLPKNPHGTIQVSADSLLTKRDVRQSNVSQPPAPPPAPPFLPGPGGDGPERGKLASSFDADKQGLKEYFSAWQCGHQMESCTLIHQSRALLELTGTDIHHSGAFGASPPLHFMQPGNQACPSYITPQMPTLSFLQGSSITEKEHQVHPNPRRQREGIEKNPSLQRNLQT